MALGIKAPVTMAVKDASAQNLALLTKDGQLLDSGKKLTHFTPAPLDQDLTLYVNADTGDDSNDGLSEAHAKCTLAAALELVPCDLGMNTVKIYAVGTFYEPLLLRNYRGGYLFIYGDSQTKLTRGVTISYCTSYVELKHLNMSGNMYGNILDIAQTLYTTINSCNIDASEAANGVGVYLQKGGTCHLTLCNISNASVAISCSGGIMRASRVGGSDNSIGYAAGNTVSGCSGTIYIHQNQMSATVQTSKEAGGIVFLEGEIV